MNKLIKKLLVLAVLCNVTLPMAGYAMEGVPKKTAKGRKFWGLLSKELGSLEGAKKVPKEYFSKEMSLETSSEDSLPKERGELDYRDEHNRVRELFEERRVTDSVNFNNQEIFSLPNDSGIMKRWAGCKYINLSHNKLEALPDEIGLWTSLSSLDLSDNRLTIAPWQVFSIGHQCCFVGALPILFFQNPIKRIPTEFFEAMMEQKDKRKSFQGISLGFDQDVIEKYIFPVLEVWPELKTYLVKSFRQEILNGFCRIQNENGMFLSFDHNENVYFDYGQGMSQ